MKDYIRHSILENAGFRPLSPRIEHYRALLRVFYASEAQFPLPQSIRENRNRPLSNAQTNDEVNHHEAALLIAFERFLNWWDCFDDEEERDPFMGEIVPPLGLSSNSTILHDTERIRHPACVVLFHPRPYSLLRGLSPHGKDDTMAAPFPVD